ncbi:hypothetical protein [Halorubrum salipaludis]|jgi:hypothetical protein|uniref:hypothetical protein n=1 Tax=Halorubrum salipaludis TaxID=2032630 RepID=UPI001181AA07|nr:hypothetical protein [Halorubrum salipaludis]
MNRRRLLIYCGVTAGISGCLGQETEPARNGDNDSTDDSSEADDSVGNDENDTTGNNSEADDDSTSHVISVSEPTDDIDESSVRCQFADLPAGAQEEVESAIDDLRSNSEEMGRYATSERPELLDTDCYAAYIHYENQYYYTGIDALGG